MFNLFKKKKNTYNNSNQIAVAVCNHVVNKEKPILYIGHFKEGCEWWVTCGEQHDDPDEMCFALPSSIFEIDSTVASVFDNLPEGFDAGRKDINSDWEIYEIEDDDEILLQKTGKYWNQRNKLDRPDGLVTLTTRRLIFSSENLYSSIIIKFLTKTKSLSFPYECISDFKSTSVWSITPAIEFYAEGEKYIFTFFSGADTEEIINIISERKQNQINDILAD